MAKVSDYTNNTPKKDYGRIGEGTFMGRVVTVILLGRHNKTNWKTGEQEYYDDGNPVVQSVAFVNFELPTERIQVEKEDETLDLPRWAMKEYAISAHEKSGFRALFSACGKNVEKDEIESIINSPLFVNVGSTKNKKDKITGVGKLMKGMECPELENEPYFFDPYNPDPEVWKRVPNFIKEKIKEANDFGQMKKLQSLDGDGNKQEDKEEDNDFDDDIPF